jgi:aerobic-type carbon monoxide dehydrogenase small subunit (CoxS/CutS family)
LLDNGDSITLDFSSHFRAGLKLGSTTFRVEQRSLMSVITLRVNGSPHTVDVDPATPLLYILRNDLGLQGPRFGCGLGQCGACSVIVNGAAVRSCVMQVSAVKGEITTLEGLARNGSLHPVQQAWIDEQVPQCGFCQNGQIITAKVLLDKNPNPSDQQIRDGMAGALCRCMTYYRVQAAVKLASARLRGVDVEPAPAGKGAV